jgi:hypothetical protein
MRGGQRRIRKSWKTTLGSQGTQSENRHSDSVKKVQLALSHGKKKKGDEVADDEDDDDAVRTSVTLCTEELFLRLSINSSPCISDGEPRGVGWDMDHQHDTFGGPSWVSHLLAGPHPGLQSFQ